MKGTLKKMTTAGFSPVEYRLPLGEKSVELVACLGKTVQLKFNGNIFCLGCRRSTNKSFAQGFCYPCFASLACCDRCIMCPELCHFATGTCREPEWGQNYCMQEHTVYLANSSGAKVGITRKTQRETRWRDQGAVQALPIATAATRLDSGRLEVAFKQFVADRTNWRKMLSTTPEPIDLAELRDQLFEAWPGDVNAVKELDEKVVEIRYPVLKFPAKVTSRNFDKTPLIEGTLLGIKGQYLILDTGVLNIRKFGGYEMEFRV